MADGIGVLVDHSLLMPSHHRSQARWRLHPTARESARSQLGAAGEVAAISQRHLEYLVATFEALFDQWFVTSDADWRLHTDALQGDLRSALTWAAGDGADPGAAATLLGASLPDWQWRDFQAYYEGARWCSAIARLEPAFTAPRRAARWFYAKSTLMAMNALERGAVLEQAKRLAAEATDPEMVSLVAIDEAEYAWNRGDLEGASALLTLAAPAVDDLGSGRLSGYHCFQVAQVARIRGDDSVACEAYRSALRLLGNSGVTCLAFHAELELGRSLWNLNRLKEALETLDALARSAQDSHFGDDHVVGFALLYAAGVCLELLRLRDAVERTMRAMGPLQRTHYADVGLPVLTATLALVGEADEACELVAWHARRSVASSLRGKGIERITAMRDAAVDAQRAGKIRRPEGDDELGNELIASLVASARSIVSSERP
jgi:tetratricopeptide (TPR) repeat protein